MNREYDYSELIEDYLTEKLSVKQRLEFEAQLEKDPDLLKDFILQKDIISAIKDVRKAELKSMLNNVNVGGGSGFNYFPIQIIGAVLFTSLLAVGTYYYFSDHENVPAVINPVVVETTPPNNGTRNNDLPVTSESEITITEEAESRNNTIAENTSSEPVESRPSNKVPDKVTEAASETSAGEKNSSDNAGNQTRDNKELNVETKKDRNHAFHYQYYEDKLFLYGDFKGSTYEILKLPTPSGTKLYMSYDGRFYKMEKSRVIRSFDLVDDPNIIEQLQKLKTK